MNKKIDFSFYNQVRARFSSLEKGMIVFISLSSDRPEELMGQIFIEETQFEEYHNLMLEHFRHDKPYAVLSWNDESNESEFFFRCKEFVRKDNILTGKTVRFRLEPFAKIDFNSEAVRADFIQLSKLLSGDSKAS